MVKNKKILVIGIGNTILCDDGIGPVIVRDLSLLFNDRGIEFREVCCGGIEIAELISGYDCVIFIDAIRTGEGKPGDIYYFNLPEFRETMHLSSIHDINFITAIELARTVGMDIPESMYIIGIKILKDSIFSEELSQPLKKRYKQILEEIGIFIKGIAGTVN